MLVIVLFDSFDPQRGGGGGTVDLMQWGYVNGGKNQNPRKFLGFPAMPPHPKKISSQPKFTPQKSHPEFWLYLIRGTSRALCSVAFLYH